MRYQIEEFDVCGQLIGHAPTIGPRTLAGISPRTHNKKSNSRQFRSAPEIETRSGSAPEKMPAHMLKYLNISEINTIFYLNKCVRSLIIFKRDD